jgi:hypothetical protein
VFGHEGVSFRDTGEMAPAESEPKVFRTGGITYLRIPAKHPSVSAALYQAVFDWNARADRDDPSFEDGSGHVIGHFRRMVVTKR